MKDIHIIFLVDNNAEGETKLPEFPTLKLLSTFVCSSSIEKKQ